MISPEQQTRITEGHARGLLDFDLSLYAGVSLTTIKRYRKKMGLSSKSTSSQQGKAGELIVADTAQRLNMHVEWPQKHNEKYDLLINRKRVEVKTAMQSKDGTWRFRLPSNRYSFHGQYQYPKNYQQDADVICAVCMYPNGDADTYLFRSQDVPSDFRIYPGGKYHTHKEDWTLMGSTPSVMPALKA